MDHYQTNLHQTNLPDHPALNNLRLVNRRTHEHAGPCPYCGGDPQRSDRLRVWLEPDHERFWCRACNERGPLRKLLGNNRSQLKRIARLLPRRERRAEASPAYQQAYRQLYAAVALWASANLRDLANPEPLAYLRQRGLSAEIAQRTLLGVTRRDPSVLVEHLRRDYPELLSIAEAAGVLTTGPDGVLCAHPNLCGCLVFPYIAEGQIVDLRTRSFPGKSYRSLAGGYESRGAVFPFGWDSLDNADTVLLTEGEIKALSVTQAYEAGRLSAPALAHPGLSYMRAEWGNQLRARGVQTVILAYDSQPRPVRDGALQLAPEELWSLRHGATLAASGLTVRVLRLPLNSGATKADLDEFIIAHGPARLQHLIDSAPDLATYQRSLPRDLLVQAKLNLASCYPTRRARPQRIANGSRSNASFTPVALSLDAARSQIATLAQAHASSGQGILVLAHPPGTGKGHNTAAGLQAYLQQHPTPGQIVWTALRKEQLGDQAGLALIPLHGRNASNCHKLGEAQALATRGYSVASALCQRRCPHVAHCAYLRQFDQEGDLFAPQPLLQATGWWQAAGVIVLDEFDPARLTRFVTLNSGDLATIARRANDPHAQTILRWLAALLGSCMNRCLSGGLLLSELSTLATIDGLDLGATLQAALTALPTEQEANLLAGLPTGATLADYANLPLNYLHTLLRQLDRELTRYRSGVAFTSRLEISGGTLQLFLRIEHLIAQLACADQPKLILDATANIALLQAIFPNTPLQVEQPTITSGARVRQIINRDWAKTTLRGPRREAWYAAVAAQIRPSRPTLVVCTLACEADLRVALAQRGHDQVKVAHYGALRGSNAYRGYDVILAQVYHPNLDAVLREGRALFADDPTPLDERIITTDRLLTDASGASWVVQVPTFADPRLAALLEQRRESELVQAALRGRPFDHPETQITLLFGLPLPQLPPTEICEDTVSPQSNGGREQAMRATLADMVTKLQADGAQVIDVDDLAQATGASVVTVRKHMAALAGRLGLRLVQRRRTVRLPQGGQRSYQRTVLMRRGRAAPTTNAQPLPSLPAFELDPPAQGMDQAGNMNTLTRLIYARRTLRQPLLRPRVYRRRLYRRGGVSKGATIEQQLQQNVCPQSDGLVSA